MNKGTQGKLPTLNGAPSFLASDVLKEGCQQLHPIFMTIQGEGLKTWRLVLASRSVIVAMTAKF